MTSPAAPLVVVLGASGGLGASTWAAALARRLSLHLGECVLVDGDVRGGGLDMTCGTEHVPGIRWPDLARLRGAASCRRLLASLPCGEVPVLSAGGGGGAVPDSAVLDVMASLNGQVPVVFDGRAGTVMTEMLCAGAAAVHVVAGLRARQLADAEAALAGLLASEPVRPRVEPPGEGRGPTPVGLTPSGANADPAGVGIDPTRVGLVTRGDRAVAPELAEVIEHLDVSHLAHLRDDARVRRDGDRGDWPGLRGALRDRADSVALDLVERLDRGAA